jgi:predicted metal-binding protein
MTREDGTVSDRAGIEALLALHRCGDFRWINPKEIVVSQWVRMKCMYGCKSYGRIATCPPNVPSVAECRQFFDEYDTGLLVHFEKRVEKPEDRHAWSKGVNATLLSVERAVFLAGHKKAFLLFMDNCGLCADCPGVRQECRNPASARPSPEALAVDVFATVSRYGYPLEVLPDYSRTMNRYAFLLID